MSRIIGRLSCVRSRTALRTLAVSLTLLLLTAVFVGGGAANSPMNTTADQVAINGYDTVAYFEDGQATRGRPEHQVLWQDARWYFANDDHRQLFAANPARYAPQFGGLCAASVAKGRFVKVDAETWAIVDGKLYLNYDRDTADTWSREAEANIAAAEQIWATRAKQR